MPLELWRLFELFLTNLQNQVDCLLYSSKKQSFSHLLNKLNLSKVVHTIYGICQFIFTKFVRS